MSELAAGFQPLPGEFQDVIRLAQERYNITVTPLQALTGGWSGAILYLVSVALHDPERVEHLILKLDHKNEKARSDEIQRHQDAARLSPPDFARRHMAQMVFERVEQSGAVAIFYTIAGQSLHQFRPLSAFESQSQLETLFIETWHQMLTGWNPARTIQQALHPQQILEQWLAFRIKPGAPVDIFLETVCQVQADFPGFLVQGNLLPNPLAYARHPDWWGTARPLDAVMGLQHGDLNTNNILVRFARSGKTIDGFYLIDFALFKEQMPLLYDLRYLEMSYLTLRQAQIPFRKLVDLIIRISEVDHFDLQQAPVETAGLCAILNKSRQAFDRWVKTNHSSLHDDLWGQYLLAGCAAGLGYCHKANLSDKERMTGLIFAAANLKRYAALFGVPAPSDGRQLYDPDQSPALIPVSSSSPSPAVSASPAGSGPSTGSRNLPTARTLTFLFADLEGSTHLWEQHPQAMKTALERHDVLLREAVEGSRGQVVKTTGDGLLAVFTSVLDGVNACLDVQQRMANEPWEETGPLRVRMGLHAGEAQLRSGDYFGPAVNRAVRLMSAAHGGQVLLSAAAADLVVDLLPEGIALRDLGEHRLKDLERPEHIFQLLHADLAADFPPLETLDIRPHNLPAQPTPLIGREAELGEILKRLNAAEVHLLTLTGAGGIGKTRIALQAAAELIDCFGDGVYFIDLAPIRDPETVPAAIAQTLGIRETSDHPWIDELKGQLRGKTMLLLLDNFEQVTAAASEVVEILRDCPQLKLLVTSREALHVRDEYIFPVPPLDLPRIDLKQPSIEQLSQYESVRLFIERAQAVKPDFSITNENAPAVAEICVRLDGLPLAIELAAARIRLFSPQALLDRLGSRLKLLRGGARDLPVRQQTLRDAIDWSFDLLDPGEQRLFEILSVFVGGCSFEAAETVAGEIEQLDETGVDILDGLSSLLEKSLIRQVDQESGEPRLLMLETIREYAGERLEANAALHASACQAHAAYYAGLTRRQWERLKDHRRDEAVGELVANIENVRTAWSYWVEGRDLEQLNKMVDSLWLLYDQQGWYQATIDLTNDMLNVLSSTPSSPERIEQEIMLQTSLARALLVVKGYTAEVEQAYKRALELSETVGEIPQLYPVLRGLGSLYGYLSQFEKANQMAEKLLSLAEHLDDASMRLEAHLMLGYSYAFTGNINLGMEYLEKVMADYNPDQYRARGFRLGNDPGVVCYSVSALILWAQGFPDRALKRSNGAVDLAMRLNHSYSLAYATFHNGLLYLWGREPELALDRAQAVLDIAEEHEFQVWKAVATCLHGAAQAGLGRPEEGLAQVSQGIQLYQGLIYTPPTFWPLLLQLQAGVYGQMGKPKQGLVVLDQALEIFPPGSEDITLPEFFRLKGTLLLAISPDHAPEAESLFYRALKIGQKLQLPMLELRAAISLSTLWRDQGKAEQGKRLLSEIYAKFNEGFTTADLMEARALLD